MAPTETIVVDALPGPADRGGGSRRVPGGHLRPQPSRGREHGKATSRELGFRASKGDVVAFLDDAFAFPNWLAALLVPYGNSQVGAVGGRVLRGEPPNLHPGMEIGRMRDDSSPQRKIRCRPWSPHRGGAQPGGQPVVPPVSAGRTRRYPRRLSGQRNHLVFLARNFGYRSPFSVASSG